MAFQFIDNQPIRFNSAKFDDQPCINKDLSAYSVLMQPGDPLHWQAKLKCCDENEACDPDTLGAELVTNGSFSADTDWTKGTGWTIGSGVATFTANGDTQALSQAIAITVGQPYKAVVDVTSNDTGYGIYVFLGARRIGVIEANTTGTFTFYGPAGSTGGGISFTTAFDYNIASTGSFSIDNVSVKAIATCYTFDTSTREYAVNGPFTGTSSPWFLGSGWTWNAGNFVRHTTPASLNPVDQLLSGIKHRHNILFSVTIANRTAGGIDFQYGGVTMQSITASASFNYSANGIGNNFISFDPTGGFDGDIDNASATETASGWSFDPENGFCHETGWVNPFYAGNTLTVGRYYRMTVEVLFTTPGGSVLIEAGGVQLGTVTETGVYTFYFTSLTTAGERFTPSSDFDGCILPTIDICFLFRETPQIRLVYEDGITGATDWHTPTSTSNPLVIKDNWATWRVNSLAAILSGGIPVALPYSCFRVQVKIVCDVLDPPSVTTTTSDTVINYKASHDCTKLFMAYSEGYALDFNFGYQGNMFRLYSRLRTLYFNPSYPINSEDYEFSSGITSRIYATRKKKYELLFDYMDEYAHDVIGLMIVCDTMIIDNVQYIADSKDYEPEWTDRGKRNLAQSIIELQKSEGILFNRNCS